MKLGRRGFLGAVGAAIASAFTPPATKRLREAERRHVDPREYERRIASYGNFVGSPGQNWVAARW